MSAHPPTQFRSGGAPGRHESGPVRTATIAITGFAAGALDLGGDAYLLDLDGVALRYESYATEHTSWSCLRDAATGETIEVSEATGEAIDALMRAFDAAYSERAGEIEAASAAVVERAVARCPPLTYTDRDQERSP